MGREGLMQQQPTKEQSAFRRRVRAAVSTASKRAVLTACGIVALCAFAAMLALDAAFPLLDAPHMLLVNPRMSFSASSSIGVTIAVGALVALWTAFSCARCFDAVVRRYLMLCGVLLEIWILVITAKYAISWFSIETFLWYVFYLPMLFVPMLCLFAGIRTAGIDNRASVRWVKRIVFAVDVVLLALVLTNNIHYLAFSFDLNHPEWRGNYTYGPVYWLVFIQMIGQFVAFFCVLLFVARKQLRSAAVPVVIVLVLGLVYALAYIARIPFIFKGNLVLMFILLICIALELCFDFGLLPSFAHYGEMFKTLPLDVKVYSLVPGNRRALMATKAAQPASPMAHVCVESCVSADVQVSSDAFPREVYKARRIAGGIALVTEDVSDVWARRVQLERKQEELRRNCALLGQEYLVQQRSRHQQNEQELYEEIELSIAQSLEKASEIVADVGSRAEHDGNDQALSLEDRKQLMVAKMLVSYCKRKGGLVLAEKSDADFDRERLMLIVGELVADLQAAGIECASLIETSQVLSAATVSVLYDCLYDFAIATLFCEAPVLMIYIHSRAPRQLEMRVVLETGETRNLADSDELSELKELLDTKNVAYRLIGEEGSLSLVIVAQG